MVAYLRVVVTARCPLRCTFCHQEGDPAGASAGGLPVDTLAPLLHAGVDVGVRKLKLLGGDPLARADLPELIRAVARPGLDLSLITAGAVAPERLARCFEAGLTRANLSIHGWSPEAFGANGGSARAFANRAATLDLLQSTGRPLKLNYVYGGPAQDADLAALLAWSAGRPLVVNVLDDLHRDELSPETLLAVVTRLRGPALAVVEEPDPWSLPTLHLRWGDGLEVEVKHQRLGSVAPWRSCQACPARARCREGIHALRLTHEGHLRPCMDRPDLALPLVPLLPHGPDAVRAAWRGFVNDLSRKAA